MRKKIGMKLCLAWLMLTTGVSVFCVGPMFWEQSTFQDFQQGKVAGCSVAQDGRISLSPDLKLVYSTEQALIWTAVTDSHGNIYLGTGHSGKVFKVDDKNQGKLFFSAKELDVFALAVDSKDNVYVGTSPDGKIYKVTPQGAATEFFNPHTKYIWSLAFDREGNLYVGTGDQGKIFRVDASGHGTLFYDTKQTHVMALKVDPQGNVLAGSFPEGILYRISPAGKGFVLYDTPLQEVHSIETAPDGSIYIGCLNEKIQPRFAPVMVPQPTPTTTESATGGINITVTEPVASTPTAPIETPVTLTPFTAVLPGQIRSAIYRVAPDLSVETMWKSNVEDVFDVLAQGNGLLFSTDSKGHIYDLSPDRKFALLAQANEAQVSQLIRRGSDVFLATSNSGRLYQLESTQSLTGTIESVAKDTQLISKWGIISWKGTTPAGTSLQFYTRSGNSARPDSTWSDWSEAYSHADGEQISSPSARFIQWKAVLKGSPNASPSIDSVSIAYLSQNIRPEILSVNVTPQGLGVNSQSLGEQSGTTTSDGEVKSGLVSEATPNVTVTAFPSSAVPSPRAVTIRWQAEDKNHDTLEFSIYVRSIHETAWRLLTKHFQGSSYILDPETLPDGYYRVKVVADDKPSNPPGSALSSEMESDIFLIDNTPPQVEVTAKNVNGETATVRFRATDSESNLRKAEISEDSGKWQMIESDDGIVDSRFEEFTFRAQHLTPGEHVFTLRVYDSSGNPGLAKAVVEVPKQ